MALDGQGKTEAARQTYIELLQTAALDSYFEMDARYQLARLTLKLWLDNRRSDHITLLEEAAKAWKSWLAHDWNKQTTKLWGYYHGACAQTELMALAVQKGGDISASKALYEEYASNFMMMARAAKGIRRYDVRFTAFFLDSPDFTSFPNEPIKCGLGNLLREFQIR